jgi:hypothetical protein
MKIESSAKKISSIVFVALILLAAFAGTANGYDRGWSGNQPPTLSSTGEILNWTRGTLDGDRYEVLRNIPGQRSEVFYINGTTVKADGTNCTTLGYKIRPVIDGAWSNETKISYHCGKHEEQQREEEAAEEQEEREENLEVNSSERLMTGWSSSSIFSFD